MGGVIVVGVWGEVMVVCCDDGMGWDGMSELGAVYGWYVAMMGIDNKWMNEKWQVRWASERGKRGES